MTSKQRVKAALGLQVPDKIPFGEFAIDFDTVEKILGHESYLRAKAKSQIALWEGRRDEVVDSWKHDTVELYQKLDCLDIINLNAEASGLVPPKDYEPLAPKRKNHNTWEDNEGRVYKFSDTTEDITLVHDPHEWERVYTIEDFKKFEPGDPPDPSIFEVIDYVIEHLGGNRFIMGPSGHPVEMVMLGSMERALTEYIRNPAVVKSAARYYLDEGNFYDQFYIREQQDAVIWGQDFSHNTGPLISPELFAEFVVPYTKERVRHLRTEFDIPVVKHACGNNWLLLDMFLEIGYACYQSIQHSAGMDIGQVKKKYGDRICLWGGVPLEHLIDGSREIVEKDVRYAIDSAGKNGGYIFGSTHSIAVGTKYDNFMTMIDTFEKLRSY